MFKSMLDKFIYAKSLINRV